MAERPVNAETKPGPRAIPDAPGGTPPPSALGEEDLVRCCLRRPPLQVAWDELYRRYAPLIRWRILRGQRVFPDSLVEDAVQEVFLKLARGALASFRGRCALRRYLVMIGDSVRISENRKWLSGKRAIWKEVADGDDLLNGLPGCKAFGARDEPASHLLSPEEQMLRREGSKRFRLLLRRLPDSRDREILRLYFGADPLTDRQIGERLGIPTNTVTWRRHGALRFLRGIGDLNDRGAVS